MQRTYSENVPATIVMKTYMKLTESKLEMKYVLKEQMGRMILILNQILCIVQKNNRQNQLRCIEHLDQSA